VLRPTLEDFVVEMPRGAQVIYPKDLAPICMLGDIGPGMRVFESGVGSGALSMTMLRWGADIVGYEIREDFANRAAGECPIVPRGGGHGPLRRPLGEQLRRDRSRRRTVRPGRARPARTVAGRPARRVRAPGRGILVAYTPSITQAAQTREQLKGRWIDARTIEVLHRGWHIDGQAVRPDHRMVAHTGFLSVARFLGKPERKP
jgi:tRNA (adenine57-N1/adenine58-N1)-methyltransferase